MATLFEAMSSLYIEADESQFQYAVVMLGGSIGSKSIRTVKDLTGVTVIDSDKEKLFGDRSGATEKVKRMNAILSPGEKKYYGLKYVVAVVVDNKYTGK